MSVYNEDEGDRTRMSQREAFTGLQVGPDTEAWMAGQILQIKAFALSPAPLPTPPRVFGLMITNISMYVVLVLFLHF